MSSESGRSGGGASRRRRAACCAACSTMRWPLRSWFCSSLRGSAARPRRDARDRPAMRSSMTAIRITLAASASGCAASTRRSTTRPAARTARPIRAAASAREALAELIGGRPDHLRRLGARPLRPAARRLHGRRRRAQPRGRSRRLGGRLWRLSDAEQAARKRGAGLWAGIVRAAARLARRAWRHGRGRARSRRRDARLAAGDLRLLMTGCYP